MVQENSKYKDSYFYQIDHASRKSFFNIFTLGSGVPYMRQEGLPGKYLVKFNITHNLIITYTIKTLVPGTFHADELMYLFNVPVPILLCDIAEFLCKRILWTVQPHK